MADEEFCLLQADDSSGIITQYAKDVTDFSSQYGSETSISYTASNLAQRDNIYPNYGDYTQACVFVSSY